MGLIRDIKQVRHFLFEGHTVSWTFQCLLEKFNLLSALVGSDSPGALVQLSLIRPVQKFVFDGGPLMSQYGIDYGISD